MINVYRVKYLSATNTRGASFKVTRIDDHRTKVTPYDHGVNNAVTHAIHATFGEDPNRLEFNKFCPRCRKHTLHRETK